MSIHVVSVNFPFLSVNFPFLLQSLFYMEESSKMNILLQSASIHRQMLGTFISWKTKSGL